MRGPLFLHACLTGAVAHTDATCTAVLFTTSQSHLHHKYIGSNLHPHPAPRQFVLDPYLLLLYPYRNELIFSTFTPRSLKERRRHVIVLLCGTSGSGKSTLASILVRTGEGRGGKKTVFKCTSVPGCPAPQPLPRPGCGPGGTPYRTCTSCLECLPFLRIFLPPPPQASRLGISTVLSTDSVRHMMRGFTSREETPLLFASTYEAGEALRQQQAADAARAAASSSAAAAAATAPAAQQASAAAVGGVAQQTQVNDGVAGQGQGQGERKAQQHGQVQGVAGQQQGEDAGALGERQAGAGTAAAAAPSGSGCGPGGTSEAAVAESADGQGHGQGHSCPSPAGGGAHGEPGGPGAGGGMGPLGAAPAAAGGCGGGGGGGSSQGQGSGAAAGAAAAGGSGGQGQGQGLAGGGGVGGGQGISTSGTGAAGGQVPAGGSGTGGGGHEQAIRGYKAQCELVAGQLEQLISGFEARRQSLVVEGVHLHVGLVLRLLQRHPGVVPFLVYIKSEGGSG